MSSIRDNRVISNAVEEAWERRCVPFEDKLENLSSESGALMRVSKKIQKEQTKMTEDVVNFENKLSSGFAELEVKLGHLLGDWRKWGTSTQQLISEMLPAVKESMDSDRETLVSLIIESSKRDRAETVKIVNQAQAITIDAITKALEDFSHERLSAISIATDALTNVPQLLERVLDIVEGVQEDVQGRLALESSPPGLHVASVSQSALSRPCSSSAPSGFQEDTSQMSVHDNLAAELARAGTSVVSFSRQSSSVQLCRSDTTVSVSQHDTSVSGGTKRSTNIAPGLGKANSGVFSFSTQSSTLQFHSLDTIYSLSGLDVDLDGYNDRSLTEEPSEKFELGVVGQWGHPLWALEAVPWRLFGEWCSANDRVFSGIFAWLVIIGLGVISYTLDTAPPSIAVAPGQEFRTWNQYRISALESRELWLELLKLEDI